MFSIHQYPPMLDVLVPLLELHSFLEADSVMAVHSTPLAPDYQLLQHSPDVQTHTDYYHSVAESHSDAVEA